MNPENNLKKKMKIKTFKSKRSVIISLNHAATIQLSPGSFAPQTFSGGLKPQLKALMSHAALEAGDIGNLVIKISFILSVGIHHIIKYVFSSESYTEHR